MSLTRRTVLFAAGAAAGVAGAKWLGGSPVTGTAYPPAVDAAGKTVLNDASLLNPTPVAKHITINADPTAELIAQLRVELAEAKAAGRPFVASAARHSMGAQSLARDATALTLDQTWIEPDTAAGTYRVAAGARWGEIIRRLDEAGFSPKVMQSNNDFGIASTFAVNAHGWPVPHSAFGSTVRSLRLMRHDGEVITCSRTQNADQFNLAMGGYGLNGVIIDLDVEMVPNKRLIPTYETMAGVDFGTRFVEALKADERIEMAYGRLDITLERFFDEALLITYVPADDQSDLPAASGSGFISKASRPLFRHQVDSDTVKGFRWFLETEINPVLSSGGVTRNSLMNEPVITLDDRDPTRTDILHEYFVPPERFGEFVAACKDVIPSSYQQLLNITLRFVDTDTDSVLAYARGPRIAAVMLFSQEMTVRGEADMARMTSALIERTLDIGGTYYLPYRLHADQAQFERGYPRAGVFVSGKREADPDLMFRNALWDRYMAHM
ncbi:MAG: FAD-binding oxidoreductase [Tepidamorphaceae bacterium]